MTELFRAVGLGVLFSMLWLLSKESGSKTAAVQLALCGAVLLGFGLVRLTPFFSALRGLFEKAALKEEGTLVLKAIGIGYVSQIGGDICRDVGAESVATKVELCARAELLLLCMPLFTGLLETAYALVGS